MKNPWKQIYKGKRSGEDFIVAEEVVIFCTFQTSH